LLISALDGREWPTSRPGRLTPEKELRYTLIARLGGTQIGYGWSLATAAIRTLDPPACSRYTDTALELTHTHTHF